MDTRKADLDALESFARAVASLKAAQVDVDVPALAELYEVDWPGNDEDDDEEPSDEELIAAHRAREAGR